MIAKPGGRWLGVVVALVASGGAVHAQTAPGGARDPAQVQACIRLESQLTALDRGMTEPARADQMKRTEDAVNRQQIELDRMVTQGRHMGCEGLGFFLFGTGQSSRCGDLNGQIQQARANLDRWMAELQRLQGGGVDRTEQRRALLSALADNDCGPQYRTATPAPTHTRGFFDSLFGGPGGAVGAAPVPPDNPGALESPEVPQASTYRTLCVRTCDGFYFPISFATVSSRFQDDERTCQRLCPSSEVTLFTHRNPGEDVSQAVSLAGKRYTALPNAFRYRQEYNASCSCKRPDQTWAQALGRTDATLERGDIVVTEERSKAMALSKPDASKPTGSGGRPNNLDPDVTNAVGTHNPDAFSGADGTPSDASDKRSIRMVGPQFLPAR
jgi:Protein of unknown function (DUF2865)